MISQAKIMLVDKKRVFVAMSGGVDSSVAAALLKKKGYDVVGVHMRCWSSNGCNEVDAEDARRVAEKLNIPFYVFDFEEEYKKKVVDYMIEGYRKGITPNPDVMCNKEIKFGIFLEKALEMGADFIATGHYVRLKNSELCIAKDRNKDQSYFLWTLTRDQLKHCFFPVGDYLKSEVRKIAKKFGLNTAEKKDSQGICFVGKVTLADFLKDYIKEKRGSVLNLAGEKIGEHRGVAFYTIGQRHGLSSGNWKRSTKSDTSQPFFVVQKDVKKNILVVSDKEEELGVKEVRLTNVNLIDYRLRTTDYSLPVFVRFRYRQSLVRAHLLPERSEASRRITYKIILGEFQKFIAPGQSAVFYDKKGTMLGGGIIF